MSERTISDEEFVHLFSPQILEQLPADILNGELYIFRSPPGGGKTTLLRAFTPGALKAIWDGRHTDSAAFNALVDLNAIRANSGPDVLGVLLSCASGYADLPPSSGIQQEGLFRALLNCRIVLRTIRSLCSLLKVSDSDSLDRITIEYSGDGLELKSIPNQLGTAQLVEWAERQERSVYGRLDNFSVHDAQSESGDVRFEGVLWLRNVKFLFDSNEVASKRLLMIDDVHKLRRAQRTLLIGELCEMRSGVPIWISERNIALGGKLLAQGVREGRELQEIALEELWRSTNKKKFNVYAQSILSRRLKSQNVIPSSTEFSRYMRDEFDSSDSATKIRDAIKSISDSLEQFKSNVVYEEWLNEVSEASKTLTFKSLLQIYKTVILIARNEQKRQLSFELSPLSADDRFERESSSLTEAAELLLNKEYDIPYYYGIDRLCIMATNNIEELLSLSAALYEELQAKQILRKTLPLSPQEQDKILRAAAKKRRDYIPKSHTYGTRAQKLLDSIALEFQHRTYRRNAPIAPGVTGFRLSTDEIDSLGRGDGAVSEEHRTLNELLAECVAENLLVMRNSSASTNRPEGTIFYLNRSLCSHYRLPLGYGGWMELEVRDLVSWMKNTPKAKSFFP
tara:strand:+ start:4316 stop:6187 length:1872 start_codon:yes stop_codon:yes gene_type:complete